MQVRWSTVLISEHLKFVLRTNDARFEPLGLPNGVMMPAFGETNLYFMGLLFPPSGVQFEEQNCYTLDVTPNFGVIEKVSGYIDALALSVNVVSPYYQSEDDIYGSSLIDETVQHEIDANSSGSGSGISSTNSDDENNKRSNSRIEQRRLDENPAACGHFMNHSPTPNSTVYTFAWEDVYPKYRPGTWNDTSKATYDLPNIARTDGAPRYIMYVGSEMIFYPVDEMRFQVKDVCGAVICANHDMETGQEVLRDYELQQPYPQWAIDWYVASPDIDGFPSSGSNTDTAIENNEKEDDGEEWRLT